MLRQDIIDASVKQYHKMVEKDSTIEPEDGFIWVLEETDFGKNLSDAQYQDYLAAINRGCYGDAIMFEQLPDPILQANYGDFRKCEGKWTLLNYDLAERLLRAGRRVLKMHEGDDTTDSLEDIAIDMREMRKNGVVIQIPFGYMRAHNELEKCPRCGCSILPDTAALSRYDNKTRICSACGTREAFEDFYGRIED